MREQFKQDLLESNFIHKPLRIHEEEMRETRCLKKKPIKSRLLDDMTSLEHWETIGDTACMELSSEHTRECTNSLKFTTVTKLDHWPRAFGRIYSVPKVMRKVDHENWEDINRISFWVYADMPGFRSISFRMQFRNGGEHPVPDRYDREGHHNVNLVNNTWTYVSVEIPYVHRDDVLGLSFEYDMVGSEPGASEIACFYITDIMLETLAQEDLDVYEGWHPGKGRIAFSGSGYQAGSIKTAVVNEPDAKTFKLVETATGRTVLEKEIDLVQDVNGTHQVLDFSEIQEKGTYLLVCGDIVSRTFPIGTDIWEDSIWKTINFLFCQRCGCRVPGKHDSCHHDVTVRHGDRSIIANGGWHDAGDMTQTTTNTSECTYALFELLDKVRDNKPLYDRVLEEALWGLEWVLRTRFGDGYRVPSSSKSCWTNGIIGDNDDIYREAALETIENFMCAGAEALAAAELKEIDPELSSYSLRCAREDWGFAYDNLDAEDFCKADDPNRICTPLLKYSAACWSAVDLYKVTGEDYYSAMAVSFADKIIDCQQQTVTDWDVPYVGFFYDDETHKLIAHCSHRSHDNEPVQALARLASCIPEHENYGKWMYAINLYTDYILHASEATAPYYVVPASIYHEDEAFHDTEYDMGMIKRYLTDDERRENYRKQVQNGVTLGKGYYLRREPVAFEHRGNHDVTLAGGKGAACAASAKNDYVLAELAQRQAEWIVGKNPFAESVMFGEGYDYCQEYAVLPGEMVGELGVGFAALDEHDSPFWPQVNTCVYKEVWIRSVLQYIWLASDLHGGAKVSGIVDKKAGKVDFRDLCYGNSYNLAVNAETGWYEGELPAGEYLLTVGTQTKHVTLLASRKYRLDGPFRDYRAAVEQDGEEVKIKLSVSGAGKGRIAFQAINLDCKKFTAEVSPGEIVEIKGNICDRKKPYYAVIIPDSDLAQIVEIYER